MNFKSFCKLSFVLCFSAFFSPAFSAEEIVNPVQGTWANRQYLVLDLPCGAQAFYSVTGNDPEAQGFAYDGPVLLDVDGDVLLKVTVIYSDGTKNQTGIIYTVKNAALPYDEESKSFISKADARGLLDYEDGTFYKIPEKLEYSFGDGPECFESGKKIRIEENLPVQRYVSCTLTDGISKWRYVMRINPRHTGISSRKNIPFEISDWDMITFTDRKLIYRIDDLWWDQPKNPVYINRAESHMISWQSIDYSKENPVEFLILPPKPEIIEKKDANGSLSLSFKGEDGYSFGIYGDEQDSSELYKSLSFDTFQGDFWRGEYKLGIYYDSILQGTETVSFSINKKMPQRPLIESSSESSYSRKLVTLNFKTIPDTELFVSVKGPVIVDADNWNSDVLFNFQKEEYKSLASRKLVLQPSKDGACAYKVQAYTIDASGNKSSVSEYRCVIDTSNYYLDASLNDEKSLLLADGTKQHPYSDFGKILEHSKESRYLHVFLKGDVTMPENKIIISSDLEISGTDNSRILFPENSSLNVSDASLTVSDCAVVYGSRNKNVNNSPSFITLDHAVLELNNVELSAFSGKNGTVITASNSVLNVNKSGITGNADAYSCILNSVGSEINIASSRLTSIAYTSSVFSVQGGIFNLRASTLKVQGGMGRAGELFDSHCSMTDNLFQGTLQKPVSNGQAVYKDSKTLTVEESGNRSSGF